MEACSNQQLSNWTQQEGNHAWSWEPTQLPREREVMDLGGELQPPFTKLE